MVRVLGWDVGGAHLKAALAENGEIKRVWREATPLHRDMGLLDAAIARIADEAGPADRHAVTMTGELSDVFPDRAEGVSILSKLAAGRLGPQTLFYAGEKGLAASASEAEAIASANWHAAGRLVAERMEAALLVDMGSTTTDITVLDESAVKARGFGDGRRLSSGELVYQGFSRTALMAVAEHVPLEGSRVPVIAEPIAVMADVRHVLEQTEEQGESGQAERRASAARLARMVGRDAAELSAHDLESLAEAFAEAQLRRIHDAALLVLSHGDLPDGAPVVAAGVGRAVVKRLATRLGRGVVDFSDLVECRSAIRDRVEEAAPACALALLAERG